MEIARGSPTYLGSRLFLPPACEERAQRKELRTTENLWGRSQLRSVSSLTQRPSYSLLPEEKQSRDTCCSRRAKPSIVGAKNMASSSGCAITTRARLPAPGRPACSGDLIRSAEFQTRRKPQVRTATATHKRPTTSMPGKWHCACAGRRAAGGLGLPAGKLNQLKLRSVVKSLAAGDQDSWSNVETSTHTPPPHLRQNPLPAPVSGLSRTLRPSVFLTVQCA